MKLIPKKTKYRLKFRNKTNTKKNFKHVRRLLNANKLFSPSDVNAFLFQVSRNQTSHLIRQPQALGLAQFYKRGSNSTSLTETLKGWIVSHADLQNDSVFKASDSNYNNPLTADQTLKNNWVSYEYGSKLLFGNYGFAFSAHGKLKSKFIETIRLDIAKALKKKSKVWLRICCDTPVTARPVETRMGKGKGAISHWEAKVSPGQIFFEFSGLTKARADEILNSVRKKSPINLKLVCT